ncbi:MAG: hypothetical protein ACJA0N_000574 [Pseudohongiellaceae bacterium]|jgi:hypothetical protein
MLIPLIIGIATIGLTMAIQVFAVVFMIRWLIGYLNQHQLTDDFRVDAYVLSLVLVVMFFGHIIQISIWAVLFLLIGEFSDIATAFYHSAVNFASLGYGDITMAAPWRLLGALEACNGVLMFGLTTGTLLTVMNKIFSRHKDRFGKINNL